MLVDPDDCITSHVAKNDGTVWMILPITTAIILFRQKSGNIYSDFCYYNLYRYNNYRIWQT